MVKLFVSRILKSVFLMLFISVFLINGIQYADNIDAMNCTSCYCTHCDAQHSQILIKNQLNYMDDLSNRIILETPLYINVNTRDIEHPPKAV